MRNNYCIGGIRLSITSKKELKFYISADLMMNRGYFKYTFKKKIIGWIHSDYIIKYLKALRKTEYYINMGKEKSICSLINRHRLSTLGLKLGFSISPNVFGYGLVIPHFGTIVVGDGNKIGNYAVLHTSTCITQGQKRIGDGLYLSTGAKIINNNITLANAVTIAANAVVNDSFVNSNCLLAGIPAVEKRERAIWFDNDGEKYQVRVEKIKEMAMKMNI